MLSAFIAILNPFSLSESIFSIGTFVSLKNTCLVDDEWRPSLLSSFPNVIPLSGSFGTIKAVRFLSSSILAKTVKISAKPAFEIHIF